MTASETWIDLEETPAGGMAGGRLRRRVGADSPHDMHLEFILPERRRAVSLTVPSPALRGHEQLPQARGLDHRLVAGQGSAEATLALELADPAAEDLFAVLAEDLIAATGEAMGPEEAVGAWVGRVARWQRLLRSARMGLSPELQRGLYAELWTLRELIGPAIGVAAGLRCWFGPDRSRHDFQMPATSLEVKSCAANQPQIVSITGERQLDESGTPALHLTHVSLDVHHNGPESLPRMIASIREAITGGGAETELEDRLLRYGYLDADAGGYERTGYTVREARHFSVGPGFPRLIEADLPDGIGRVRYRLAIAACADFEIDEDALATLIAGPS